MTFFSICGRGYPRLLLITGERVKTRIGGKAKKEAKITGLAAL